MRGATPLLAGLLLAGCALAPPAPQPARDTLGEFAIDARFALRTTLPGQAPESSGGRLAWEHRRTGDRILIANPLGTGVAEIESGPAGARLQLANGRVREAAEADTLVEEVTGQRLPVRRLPDWLLGRGGERSRLVRDASGRPLRLDDAGWRVDYGYADAAPAALPASVALIRPGEVELKLRIENWRALP